MPYSKEMQANQSIHAHAMSHLVALQMLIMLRSKKGVRQSVLALCSLLPIAGVLLKAALGQTLLNTESDVLGNVVLEGLDVLSIEGLHT